MVTRMHFSVRFNVRCLSFFVCLFWKRDERFSDSKCDTPPSESLGLWEVTAVRNDWRTKVSWWEMTTDHEMRHADPQVEVLKGKHFQNWKTPNSAYVVTVLWQSREELGRHEGMEQSTDHVERLQCAGKNCLLWSFTRHFGQTELFMSLLYVFPQNTFLSQCAVVCTVTYKLNFRVLEIAQNYNGPVAHHKGDMQTYIVCSMESVLLPLFTLVPSLAVFHYFP